MNASFSELTAGEDCLNPPKADEFRSLGVRKLTFNHVTECPRSFCLLLSEQK